MSIIENSKRLYRLKVNQELPQTPRYLFSDIVSSKAKLTAIYGSRGIGKTTILMQLLKQSPLPQSQKLYISCDHAMFQGVSLFDVVDEFSKKGGELICIDEVHEAEGFEQALKSIYDFLDIKVFFTGSSALHLTSPDFARRYSRYHLYPLSFREYLQITQSVHLQHYSFKKILKDHENIASNIIDVLEDKKILKHFNAFLAQGAYPFYFEDEARYVDRMNETINTIIQSDLSKIFSISPDKISTLKKLLITICVSEPLEMSVDKLAKTVGITKVTLYKYIQYLGDAELIYHVMHQGKRFANIRKPDKLYLANSNLFEALCISKSKGTVRETFFASAVAPGHSLHYVDQGDFLVDEEYTIEIGGKNKSFSQLKGVENAFVAADDIELGTGRKIPLWVFGFLY
ncbi:MAG: ATP-binding protein [Gammaproteobacteria bacterium]|nr:ATP-binding protein [Gammaproteobacteria bacterium]